jgi:cyclophilin family peptidyl-prolyl cis-trans isomerase
LIHRIIPDFVIQGGGFGPSMTQKPTYEPIRNEAADLVQA